MYNLLMFRKAKSWAQAFMEKSMYEKIIACATDFCIGFFVSPFLYFIAKVSVRLIKDPGGINDGNAILFVAFLTGIIFLLKRDMLSTIDINKKSLSCFAVGLVLFWIIYFCF